MRKKGAGLVWFPVNRKVAVGWSTKVQCKQV